MRAGVFFVAAVLALAPRPATSQTIAPCMKPVPTAEQLFAEATAGRYAAVDPETGFSPDLVARLKWALAVPYLFGDSGGEGLTTILQLQEKAASNIARLKTTPKSATRVVADDISVAILRWQEAANGTVSVTCTEATFLDQDLDLPQHPGHYGTWTTTSVETGVAQVALSLERFVPDWTAVRAAVPDATPPTQIVTIRMSYNPEVLP